jgi:hypothetical protein
MFRLPLPTAVMLAFGVPASAQHSAVLTTDEVVSAMR